MKKSIAAVIAAIVILTVNVLSVDAISDRTGTVTVANISAKPGEAVSVAVNFSPDLEVSGAQFDVMFDGSALIPVGIAEFDNNSLDILDNITDDTEDRFSAVIVSTDISAIEGFNLNFKISEDCKPGIYPLTLEKLRLSDDEANTLSSKIISGSVRVLNEESNEFQLGDVDLNGSVTVADVVFLSNYLIDEYQFTVDLQFLTADIDGDKEINVKDLIYIVLHLSGKHLLEEKMFS
ncbi:MAG: dockerin type I domain-containing protein [Oscillospiraceae bacterium]|nr:dockerin type I domain-containing protein [Oscillospiraceae bacterium]